MRTRQVTDARGTWTEKVDDAGRVFRRVLESASAALDAENATIQAAATAAETKRTNNLARIDLLGRKAARYAKDPVANAADKLTDRQIHELLARLALATVADDV